MRVLELAVSGEVVNDGDFSRCFGLGFGPNFGSLWTGFSVCSILILWDLEIRCFPPGTGSGSDSRHFCSLLFSAMWTVWNKE